MLMPGGFRAGNLHGELHELRQDLRRLIRHALGDILDRELLAQMVAGRGGSPAQFGR